MTSRRLLVLLLGSLLPVSASAALRSGKVVDRNGDPLPRASVIVRETLEAATTDDEGGFKIELPDSGLVTFAITAPGKDAVDRSVDVTAKETLVLKLDAVAPVQVNMEAMTIDGGVYSPTAPTAKNGSLSPIEVILTPGAAGDLNRALQTLPGVQNVDDGNALFVRGGDYWETAPFINGGVFPSAVRLEAPTGTFVGTVGPFLTKKITFLSGGFDVRYGNLLSGVVALETLDRATDFAATLNVGLGALSFGGNFPIGKSVGIRVTATRFDLEPVMWLNGSSRKFSPPPTGSDLSASAVWDYRRGGELKLFVIRQAQQFGIEVEGPSYRGFYEQSRHSEFAVLSWKDGVGNLSIEGNFSAGNSHSDEGFGGLEATTRLPSQRWFTQLSYPLSSDIGLSAGVEGERVGLRLEGRKPTSVDALAPDAAQIDLRSRVDGRRNGFFFESAWTPRSTLTVVAGVRTDRSTLTRERTADPRISASYQVAKKVTLTGSVGLYHQVPDILFYTPALGGGALPSMQATQEIVGLQFGEGDRQLKIEAYRKEYRDLTQFTRSRTVSRGGGGRSQGVDIFAKTPLPAGLIGRLTVSLADVERTDPDSGVLSAAPFGIRNSTTVILQRAFAGGYQTGLSWRYGSGRPVTDITGSTYDAVRQVYAPIYGAPYAARFPESQRLDLSVSKITWHGAHYATVWYLSLSNVLGRKNVYDYVYSADYRERRDLPSILNRSVYFGVTVMYR